MLLTMSVNAQISDPKHRNMFLVGEFGEVCTMCEVIVLCEASDAIPAYDAIPPTGSFTLYHLQTRTFWSQISTIWDWFIANFSSESLAQGHERPAVIYTVNAGVWSAPVSVNAHISIEPPRLSFGDHFVDRSNQIWLRETNNSAVGYCQRLPLWDGLEVIAAKNPRAPEQ